jgi:hypothetical protein
VSGTMRASARRSVRGRVRVSRGVFIGSGGLWGLESG